MKKLTNLLLFIVSININLNAYIINSLILENENSNQRIILYGSMDLESKSNIDSKQEILIKAKIDQLINTNKYQENKIKIFHQKTNNFFHDADEINQLLKYLKIKEMLIHSKNLESQRQNLLDQKKSIETELESNIDDLSFFTSLDLIDKDINIFTLEKIKFKKTKIQEEIEILEKKVSKIINSLKQHFDSKLNIFEINRYISNFERNNNLLNKDFNEIQNFIKTEIKELVIIKIKIFNENLQTLNLNIKLKNKIEEYILELMKIEKIENINQITRFSKIITVLNTIFEILKDNKSEKFIIFSDLNPLLAVTEILILNDFKVAYNSGLTILDNFKEKNINPLKINLNSFTNPIKIKFLNEKEFEHILK